MCNHSRPKWTWEQWQWSSTPHSPKLQHYWNLNIRLFSVISRTLIGVFYSLSQMGKFLYIYIYIYIYICLHVCLYVFTNPSAQAGCDTRSIFKQRLTGLTSGFSFSKTSCYTKFKEPSLHYFSIAGKRIVGYITFSNVLALCEMQTASFRVYMCERRHYGIMTNILDYVSKFEFQLHYYIHFQTNVMFWPLTRPPKMLFQGDAPEGSDTFQWPVIERDRVGGLRLIIWDKVKVPLCQYRLIHPKRVTSELPDSYFCLMTIKHLISKIQWAIMWALNYYLTQLS